MVTTMQCEGSKHSIILDGSDTKEAGQGADPHSALLSALCGCQTTILNKMCEEEKVRLNSLMFDVRGWQDSGATQRDSKASSKLQRVDMDVQVDSDASQDQVRAAFPAHSTARNPDHAAQLDSMAKQLLRRSPMTNLLHDAGVKLRLNVKQMTENE